MRTDARYARGALTFTILLAGALLAADTSGQCMPSPHVGFFNGVWNTQAQAEWSMLILDEVPTTVVPPSNYVLFYNETGLDPSRTNATRFEDLVETFEQRASENGALLSTRVETFWEILRGDRGPTSVIGRIEAAAPDVAVIEQSIESNFETATVAFLFGLASSPPTENDLSNHRTKLDELAATGEKVVLVGHSQGNLFLSAAFDYIAKQVPASHLSAVRIAPASILRDGQDYTLADLDLIINVLLRADGPVPPANVKIPLVPDDLTGHELVATYLNRGLNTFGDVRAKFDVALKVEPMACPSAGEGGAAGEGGEGGGSGETFGGAGNAGAGDFSEVFAPVLSMGTYHGCVVGPDGSLGCWQSITSTAPTPLTPDPVSLDPVSTVSASDEDTCAVTQPGSLSCWGNNTFGQLGNGTTDSADAPVAVPGISDAVAVAAGASTICLVEATGAVQCAGHGVGRVSPIPPNSQTFVPVQGITGATAVSMVDTNACVLARGNVLCWGDGFRGVPASNKPVAVAGVSGASQIVVGDSSACVVAGGAVKCWGGLLLTDGSPAPIPGVTNAIGVAVSTFFGCVLSDAGVVSCWSPQTATMIGKTTVMGTTPVPIPEFNGATSIAAGLLSVCARFSDGTVECVTA